ncbi:MAG: NTP transferase domain-containing protein [Candidatus Zixiibacteriota bacterium]
MKNRFKEIDCFILAGGESNPREDFQPYGELTRLEQGYRNYARLFEKVTLVLKKDQAREWYLNYPHVCDESPELGPVHGVEAALNSAESDVVFIGSADIYDFPAELVAELIRNYDGELFLGYRLRATKASSVQPLFGLYNKKLAARLRQPQTDHPVNLAALLKAEGRLLPLPASIPAEQIGLH